MSRNYKVKFRINIGDNSFNKDSNFHKYYLPKWSQFMREVNSRKLTSIPQDNTASVRELPALRALLKDKIKTINIVELLNKKDAEYNRLLLDVSPMFDSAPVDLKAHILATFGVTHKELKEFLEK